MDGSGAAPRFTMLETVREFASERLEADPAAAEVRDAHARFYCEAVQELGSNFPGGRSDRFRQLDTEYENVRAALGWSASGGSAAVGHRIVGSLRFFWVFRDLYTEGFAWVRRYLSLDEIPETDLLGRTYLAGGVMQCYLGDRGVCRDMLLAAESHAKTAGDRESEAWALSDACGDDMSNPERHGAIEEQILRAIALFKDIDLPFGVQCATNNIGELMRMRGRHESALAAYMTCISIADENSMPSAPAIIANVGDCQRHLGNISGAVDAFRQSLRLALEQEHGNHTIAWAIESLASVAEDPAQAARLMGASDSIRETLGTAVPPADRAAHDEMIAAVRSRLSKLDFERHFAEGKSLSLDEAVAEALLV